MRKPTIWVPTRSGTNRTVQSQKQARSLKIRVKVKRYCTICVAKTKALISCAVAAQLICAFVFAYANCWFSHAVAHICSHLYNSWDMKIRRNDSITQFLRTSFDLCIFLESKIVTNGNKKQGLYC